MKLKKILFIIALVFIQPIIFIVSLYSISINTHLPGRRGGPQDAFRHVYSTALVARYFSPKIVILFTEMTERDSSSMFDLMDRHNNMIGIQTGLESGNLYDLVMIKIKSGQINSNNPHIITWLPPDRWTNSFRPQGPNER